MQRGTDGWEIPWETGGTRSAAAGRHSGRSCSRESTLRGGLGTEDCILHSGWTERNWRDDDWNSPHNRTDHRVHFDGGGYDDEVGIGSGHLESPTALAAAQRHLLAALGEGSLTRPQQAPAPCPFQSHHRPHRRTIATDLPRRNEDARWLTASPFASRGRKRPRTARCVPGMRRCAPFRAFTHPALGRPLGTGCSRNRRRWDRRVGGWSRLD